MCDLIMYSYSLAAFISAGGDDKVSGGEGDDILYGGPDADTLIRGQGRDASEDEGEGEEKERGEKEKKNLFTPSLIRIKEPQLFGSQVMAGSGMGHLNLTVSRLKTLQLRMPITSMKIGDMAIKKPTR